MKKIIAKYYEKWYLPILVAGILGVIGILTISTSNKIIFFLSIGIPFVALIISGLFGIFRLLKKEYLFGSLQIIITGVLGVIGLYIVSFIIMFYPYDFYADNLKIPKGIEIYNPIGGSKNDLITDFKRNNENLDFTLFNSFQPGLFEYEINIGKINKGEIYLKAFEITKNDRLSEQSLQRKTKILIENKTENIKVFKSKKHFTIYEGDWGKPYAVRFEVWYKKSNGSEIKLTEKNYKIEGWQR